MNRQFAINACLTVELFFQVFNRWTNSCRTAIQQKLLVPEHATNRRSTANPKGFPRWSTISRTEFTFRIRLGTSRLLAGSRKKRAKKVSQQDTPKKRRGDRYWRDGFTSHSCTHQPRHIQERCYTLLRAVPMFLGPWCKTKKLGPMSRFNKS